MSARPRSDESRTTSVDDDLARYYDLDMLDVTEDIGMYLELARGTGGPILELAAGTGRVAIPLARRGHRVVALDNVSFDIERGQIVGLIGPNGAGKTTLLQVAATLMFPTEGTVEVLGERLGEVDIFDLRPRIGLTSAAIAEQVPPGEKVIDLVLTASYAILGRWKEEYDSGDVTRAVEILDALGCAHLIRRRFATLSEGERKRVQIARALMPDPELLLLDEPAAGLDLGGREDLLRRLTTLARDPKAPMMVLVTHHVEEVPDGFTHAMLLRRGSVLAAGPIENVFTARNLSRCFGVQLEIEHRQSRWTARAR